MDWACRCGVSTRSSPCRSEVLVRPFAQALNDPSTTWLLRHFADRLEQSPEGVDLDVEDAARSLGLGERLSPNAPFARTVKRCVDFEMAKWQKAGLLAVRWRLPPLPRRHLRRLPSCLQSRYEFAPVGSLPSDRQDLPRNGARTRPHL